MAELEKPLDQHIPPGYGPIRPKTVNDLAFRITLIYGFLLVAITFFLFLATATFDGAELDNNGNIKNEQAYADSVGFMNTMWVWVDLLLAISLGYAALMYYLKNNPKGFN